MPDISKELTRGLETHHTTETERAVDRESTALRIPNIIRLSVIAQKLRSENDRVKDTETEKNDLEEYLIDTQAKIKLFREVVQNSSDQSYTKSEEDINNWESLFNELISHYYSEEMPEFEDKVSARLKELREPDPNKKNLTYQQRLQKLLENPRFKRILEAKLFSKNPALAEATIKEFIDTANSLNLFKILNKIEPKISRKYKDKETGAEKELSLEDLNVNEIKKQINLKTQEAEKIKNLPNPNVEELRKIDQEIKILLAPILRKISLVYTPEPGKKLSNSEGTSLASVILNDEAVCAGAAEIIRLVTEYLGLEGRSVYYPGHVNYEIQLPSGDILLNDNNGNFRIDPKTGEAQGETAAKYYKTLRKVANFSELSEEEKKIVYRRLNSEGEVGYYLPEDGKNYPYLQYGIVSSGQSKIPQALVNNMPELFFKDDPEAGFNFINQVYLENNPYGAELQTGIENVYELSPESLKALFQKMLEIDQKTIFTCQKISFIEEQITALPDEKRREILLQGQKYLMELLEKDTEFFIFLKLHVNLYLFEKMLLKEGIGNPIEVKNKIKEAISIYEEEIKKYPIEKEDRMNREYQERNNKIKAKINTLNYLLEDL
jgi:hypothetical protein